MTETSSKSSLRFADDLFYLPFDISEERESIRKQTQDTLQYTG